MFWECNKEIPVEEKAEMLDLARFFRHMHFDVTLDDNEITLFYELTHSHFMFCSNEVNRMRLFVLDAYDYFLDNSETTTHEELKEKGLSTLDWHKDKSPIPLDRFDEENIENTQCTYGVKRLLNKSNLDLEQAFVQGIRDRVNKEAICHT